MKKPKRSTTQPTILSERLAHVVEVVLHYLLLLVWALTLGLFGVILIKAFIDILF